MAENQYDWKRFWLPDNMLDASSSGYLSEIEELPSEHATSGNTLEELEHIPCLILLGPPGIGKSSEMRRAADLAGGHGRAVEYFEIRRFFQPSDLVQRIGECARKHSENGTSEPLTIFLDGLDEAVHLQAFADAIPSAIRAAMDWSGSIKTVALRLSCRAASWPAALFGELQSIWPGDDVRVFRLAPLREQDVYIAALSLEGGETAASLFTGQIRERNVEPLASRPVTLKLLINEFRRDRSLSSSRAQLYERGMLALLEETNPVRRSQPPVGQLDSASRLIVAARMAAATIFSNSTLIWTGLQSEVPPNGAVKISDIVGGYEPGLGGSFPIEIATLFQVLGTPVFGAFGRDEFEFAHKTFLEFLAGYYLVAHELSPDEMLTILAGPPADGQARIHPQLWEVAAWASSLDHALFRKLIRLEPELLLQSDVAAVGDQEREALVDELLTRFDTEQLLDWDPDLRQSYPLLFHANLGAQLSPYISGGSHSIVARRVAIDIAEATTLKAVSNELIQVALNESDNIHIRMESVNALSKIGTLDQKTSLRPILDSNLQNDVDDELKGAVLRALWPGGLSFVQLLGFLTPPKNRNLIGAYALFLYTMELPRLNADESTEALGWIESILSTNDSMRRSLFERLISRLLKRAWENAGHDQVLSRFAGLIDYLLEDARGYWAGVSQDLGESGFLEAYYATNLDLRVKLFEYALALAKDPRRRAKMLLHLPWPLLRPSDLPSLVIMLPLKPEIREPLIEVVTSLLSRTNLNELEFVWEAAQLVPELANALAVAHSLELGSDSAALAQRIYLQESKPRSNFDPDAYSARITKELDKVCAGAPEDWWKVEYLLFINDLGKLDVHEETKSDLSRSRGWALLSAEDQARVVSSAAYYLNCAKFDTSAWLKPNEHHRPAAAGYRAIYLLLEKSPERYSELQVAVWERWAAAILGYGSNDHTTTKEQILRDLYSKAPTCVLDLLKKLISANTSRSRQLLDDLDTIFDLAIGSVLWATFLSAEVIPELRSSVLEHLLKWGYEPTLSAALSALSERKPIAESGISNEETLISATAFLLTNNAENAWPLVKSLIQENAALATSIWLSVASEWGGRGTSNWSFLNVASATEIAQLYEWLFRNFPKQKNEDEDRPLSSIDHVDDLRRALLAHLVELGSLEAVAAIRKLSERLPTERWLRYQINDAQKSLRKKSWRSLQPREVLLLVSSFAPAISFRSTVATINAELSRSASGSDALLAVDDVSPVPMVMTLLKSPKEVKHSSRVLKLLCVASEWSSAHGGLSSFNRELCKALVALGHDVTCLVVDATVSERSDAARTGVTLVECPAAPGTTGLQRLLLFRTDLLSDYVPDAVIGHDHITGTAGNHISLCYRRPYVHFIHTLPEEIEPFKARSGAGTSPFLRGSEKRKAQVAHCMGARLVVCVGPRIFSEVSTVIGTSCDAAFVQIVPGMDERLLAYQPRLDKTLVSYCLFLGRLEDWELKGADLACRMIRELNTGWQWPHSSRPKMIMRGFDPARVSEQIAALGGFDDVIPYVTARSFTDDADEVASDIKSASIVVMPSKREGFGLVALEGIAAGIPVLASVESGVGQYLLQAGQEGIISSEIAAECVVDVDGEKNAITGDWATRGHRILTDRSAAFARASSLRSQLRDHLNWRRAAQKLTEEIQAIL